MKRALLALTLLTAIPAMPHAVADESAEVRISRFSGKPVPRFVSLKNTTVNGRRAPSLSQPIEWEYVRQGLPVLVIKESGDWRFVRDPAGDEVWIKDSQLSETRTALVRTPVTLRSGPQAGSDPVATLGAGVVVTLGACDVSACEVGAGRYKGWAPREGLWGTELPGD